MQTVKAKIIKIGKKSHGVKIPKSLLKETGFKGDVEIQASANELVIRPAKHPRDGWDKEFEEMAKNGDDVLLDPYIPTQFDLEEWEW